MSLAVLSVIALTGLVLSRLWWRALQAGEYWHKRWLNLLQRLEPAAMGDLFAMRPTPGEQDKHPRAKLVAKHAAILFTVLWSFTLVYALGCLYAKWQHFTFI
jgi:hypothetical protein